jgi:hypothetical protein
VITLIGANPMIVNVNSTYEELGATAVDAVDGDRPVTVGGDTVNTLILATYEVTYSAQDTAGNSAQVSRFVTVVDNEPPTISQSNIMTFAGASGDATVVYTPTAADNFGVPSVSCTPESGTIFAIGVTSVTCTATDDAGNSADVTFDVTVNDGVDPTISQADILVTAIEPAGIAVSYTPTTSDNVGVTSVNCSVTSGTIFAIGVTSVTCTATDAAGNSASDTFTVTVNDGVPPTIVLLPDADEFLLDAGTPWVDPGVTATDNFSTAIVTIDYRDENGTITGVNSNVVGTYYVDYTATDAAFNSSTATRTVTVFDNTPPVINVGLDWPDFTPDGPFLLDPDALDPTTVAISWPVVAEELEGISISCNIVPSDEPIPSTSVYDRDTSTLTTTFNYSFPIGDTTVACIATDQAGNSSDPADATFVVSVGVSAKANPLVVRTDSYCEYRRSRLR